MFRSLLLLMVLALSLTAPFWAQNEADIYREVSPSVVSIAVEISWSDSAGGAGFVIDNDGHILTNAHVVEAAKALTVIFHDGFETSAHIVGMDTRVDLAVIKVDTARHRLKPVTFGDSDALVVGEAVVAIGSPHGLDATLTRGIISGLNRSLEFDDGTVMESAIQTDAALAPGNSGGPLLNQAGEVIGVNTAGYRGTALGFAIPSNVAQRVSQSIIDIGPPTPTPSPTATLTPTATPTPTLTRTPKPTATLPPVLIRQQLSDPPIFSLLLESVPCEILYLPSDNSDAGQSHIFLSWETEPPSRTVPYESVVIRLQDNRWLRPDMSEYNAEYRTFSQLYFDAQPGAYELSIRGDDAVESLLFEVQHWDFSYIVIECERVMPFHVSVESTVNLRSGPGTDHAKVGVARPGDILEVTGYQAGSPYNWLKVSYDGGEARIAESLTREN